MSGNSFGVLFRVTTFGESHGPAVGCVIDGCPPGVRLDEKLVQKEMDRRRPGQSEITTSRSEADRCEILSGIFEGKTTGTPIAVIIRNEDVDSSSYDAIKDLYRPGHADFSYRARYGARDHRGGGRSSGRETAARVAAGAVAKAVLAEAGVEIYGHTVKIGKVEAAEFRRPEIERNPVRCADRDAAGKMREAIERARKEGDSLGGIVEVVAAGVPAGLGEPVFSKLDADIAGALMSIGAVKGVEMGAGFRAAGMRGSEMNDPIVKRKGRIRMPSNNAGGVLGGISTGEDIVARIAVKPTPSISKRQKTVDLAGNSRSIEIKGRHDPCICPRIVPVAEAMLAMVLADHLLRLKAVR